MNTFQLESSYQPTGDQPQAIEQLVSGVRSGLDAQVLLGVTGSGKTFTMANVIAQLNRPTLILSHNKTLAAQLYSEMRAFFPHNAVEYFVSYYDYYQPEAYLPVSDTYIEKDLSINEEIDRLRLSATAALLSGRKDVVVVSSVSCLYGIGSPQDFSQNCISVRQGDQLPMDTLLKMLVAAQYVRNDIELTRGRFRVTGDTVDIALAYADYFVRIAFFGNEIDELSTIDPKTGEVLESFDSYRISPATIFCTSPERIASAIDHIRRDMATQVQYFQDIGEPLFAKRIEDRVKYDLEMIGELGYCSGVENYSRYFDGRDAGTPPYCLLDYFPEDMLLFIDESHQTVPQISGMYKGDLARKENLINYGFRLPAARDNRPLTFEEFCQKTGQTIFVSATPAEYELSRSEGVVVEQLIRPTGLLDPVIEVRPSRHQIDDLLEEIHKREKLNQRVLITTFTREMAEQMDARLRELNVRSSYIHSKVDTLDRVRIMDDLRKGVYDVLVGVNLLREGLDLPEVSLVVIMDADKESFLRDERSLTQTAGRAARHVEGRVILYADRITKSMQATIDSTNYRRSKQDAYNREHGITPTAVHKALQSSPLSAILRQSEMEAEQVEQKIRAGWMSAPWNQLSGRELEKAIDRKKEEMLSAARKLDFDLASRLRDEMFAMEQRAESLRAIKKM